jgi:uncharacterized protein involved in propanediol utilization
MFNSEAFFRPDTTGVVSVDPIWRIKAKRAAEVTLVALDAEAMGGSLRVRSNVPTAWGLGSSTSDVTSTIRAVAEAMRVKLTGEAIAKLAICAEAASDPLMLGERAVLFGHRSGVVIEDFGGSLPQLEVLGFNTDPANKGVNTLKLKPARYSWWEIEAFRPLVGLLRQAVLTQNPRLVSRVASASARINQRHLRTPKFDHIEKLADEAEAIGVQVAHSGTVAGLLFDPADANNAERINCARAKLQEFHFNSIWHFHTGPESEVMKWERAESAEQSPIQSNFLEWSS